MVKAQLTEGGRMTEAHVIKLNNNLGLRRRRFITYLETRFILLIYQIKNILLTYVVGTHK